MCTRYRVLVGWDEEAEVFVAQCVEIPSCFSHSVDAAKALLNVYGVIQEHTDLLKSLGITPASPNPFRVKETSS